MLSVVMLSKMLTSQFETVTTDLGSGFVRLIGCSVLLSPLLSSLRELIEEVESVKFHTKSPETGSYVAFSSVSILLSGNANSRVPS